MSASEVANIAAPPIPCRARAPMSAAGLRASPQAKEANVNTARPTMKMRFRPKRSARAPWVRISAARLRA